MDGADKPKRRGSERAEHIRTAHTSKDDASFEDFRLFTIDHFQKRREKPSRPLVWFVDGESHGVRVKSDHSRAGEQQKVRFYPSDRDTHSFHLISKGVCRTEQRTAHTRQCDEMKMHC